ncbi:MULTISPECIES: metal-dependent transcriptional regulator [Kocuria]|jgi:DtxR family Mn-dependent transcriptional regulator|uniref:metal-dependent transcriptional regulator n=1 Tax=Kocuria TaxID=57493 RepID=UPI002041DA69|nr:MULTISPECIES: metal-dependent transcriptional regulator [Kocuria]MCM3689278.1 metal-dependent transcriptional regulator [Kocuria rosea]HST71208.1 metal-dependent transcriptional regulator [Kocuria rosea]
MSDLIDTTEMYLRTVLELEEEGITPMRARIVERLGHSGPTVSQTVSRMERDGLLTVGPDRSLVLTEAGRVRAVQVMRKHRLAERLLADVIGLDLAQVHDEACRWEHVMSEQVERRLVDLLHSPRYSPYGTPIPGLGALGVDEQPVPGPHRTLLEAARSAPEAVHTIALLPEFVQADTALLRLLSDVGILTGAEVRARTDGQRVLVEIPATGRSAELDLRTGAAIRVLTS